MVIVDVTSIIQFSQYWGVWHMLLLFKGVFACWTFNRIISLETTERYNVYIVGVQIKQPSIPKHTHSILKVKWYKI